MLIYSVQVFYHVAKFDSNILQYNPSGIGKNTEISRELIHGSIMFSLRPRLHLIYCKSYNFIKEQQPSGSYYWITKNTFKGNYK